MTLRLTTLTTILIVAFAECKVRENGTYDIYEPFFTLPAWKLACASYKMHLVLTELRAPFHVKLKLSYGFLLCMCILFGLRVHQDPLQLLTILLPLDLFDNMMLLQVRNRCHLLLIHCMLFFPSLSPSCSHRFA